MFASGDDGVGDGDTNPKTQKCFTKINGHNETRFMPSFPARYVFTLAVLRLSLNVWLQLPIVSCPIRLHCLL